MSKPKYNIIKKLSAKYKKAIVNRADFNGMFKSSNGDLLPSKFRLN